MKINSEEELAAACIKAGELLQEIDDYKRKNEKNTDRFKFPRGYLNKASDIKVHYEFIDDNTLRSNIAYTVILIQSMSWLVNRTDVKLTAQYMIFKFLIFLRGSIVEAMLKHRVPSDRKYGSLRKKAYFLLDEGVISQEIYDDIDWLWDIRCNAHLTKLDEPEHQQYEIDDVKRAWKTVVNLRQALTEETKN